MINFLRNPFNIIFNAAQEMCPEISCNIELFNLKNKAERKKIFHNANAIGCCAINNESYNICIDINHKFNVVMETLMHELAHIICQNKYNDIDKEHSNAFDKVLQELEYRCSKEFIEK